MQSKRNVRLALVFVAFLALVAWPAVAEGPGTLVGTWEFQSVTDGVAGATPGLATFHDDGTVIVSGNRDSASLSHGSWTRSGPRSFRSKTVFLIFGPDGIAQSKAVTVTEVETNRGGESFDAVFSSEIQLLDGTPVANATGTISGTRLTAD